MQQPLHKAVAHVDLDAFYAQVRVTAHHFSSPQMHSVEPREREHARTHSMHMNLHT